MGIEVRFCICGKIITSNAHFCVGHRLNIKPKPTPNHHPCACGKCGELVTSDKSFIKGHNRRGVSHAGKNNPFYGKSHTRETIEKLSVPKSEEAKNNMSLVHLNKPLSAAHREAISKAMQGINNPMYDKFHTEESRQKMSVSTKTSIEINGHPMQGKHQSEEAKNKTSKTLKNKWASDFEYTDMMCKAFNRKPNRPETLMELITREYWTGWKYTGDYSVVINGKNPDFINEEIKQIIEVYGDYWHDGEDPTDRAEIFAEAGYETCVIWENELNNLDHVILKLRRFMNGGINAWA